MRTKQEMFELILDAANSDERIRAVSMEGSRADSGIPHDKYQDYDISYYVEDIEPFFNNPEWVIEKFGKPLIMQMPEAMRWPEGNGHFNYMMIYPDGVRLDLSFHPGVYDDDGEPTITLLDKDNGTGLRPKTLTPNNAIYNIKPPDSLFYYSCCNNFWWCLNNVAKGIARSELAYVMNMRESVVRSELHDMMDWYIGTEYGFNISTGKAGRFFKRYLSDELYRRYAATYSGAESEDIWKSLFIMCDLFHDLAICVAKHFGFVYRQDEEDGIREYLRMVKHHAKFLAPIAAALI